MTTILEAPRPTRPLAARFPLWARVLVGGSALWALAVGVLVLTRDVFVEGAVVLGTFVVPLALLAGLVSGGRPVGLDRPRLAWLFGGGGLVGFLLAACLEQQLGSRPPVPFAACVGIIEETAKLGVLVAATRHVEDRSAQSGFVLGAVVGLGFSAFESAGYALASAVSSPGRTMPLIDMVLTRAVTIPVTHGLWTALAGAALFASSRNGRLRPAPLALAALLAVAVAHAGWDMLPNLAGDVASGLGGAGARHGLAGELLGDAGLAVISLPALHFARRLLRRPPGAREAPAPATLKPARREDRPAA